MINNQKRAQVILNRETKVFKDKILLFQLIVV